MQDTFDPWIQKDPTCQGATKPVRHNYWTCTVEPGSCNYWAHVPEIQKPARPRAYAPQQEKPPQWEIRASQLEKSLYTNEDPAQPKINKIF